MLTVNAIMIQRERYGDYKGQYTCVVSLEGTAGEIKLNLNQTLTRKVLDVVSEEIVIAAREVAQSLTTETLQSNLLTQE